MLWNPNYHQPMSSSLKCPSPTRNSIPWLDRWPLRHKSREIMPGLYRFSQRTISSSDPERARFWQAPIQELKNVKQKRHWFKRWKRPSESWESDVIDCKLTRRVGNSICVLSNIKRSIMCNFPKCQKALDSKSRHPRKFSSENKKIKLAYTSIW
jgi:hypothetical protein